LVNADFLNKAIAADAGFALAYAPLAGRYVYEGRVHGRADDLPRVEAGHLAVRLDPQLARSHHALGFVLNRAGGVEEARRSMQRAIERVRGFGPQHHAQLRHARPPLVHHARVLGDPDHLGRAAGHLHNRRRHPTAVVSRKSSAACVALTTTPLVSPSSRPRPCDRRIPIVLK
jgi:hypothetical protein